MKKRSLMLAVLSASLLLAAGCLKDANTNFYPAGVSASIGEDLGDGAVTVIYDFSLWDKDAFGVLPGVIVVIDGKIGVTDGNGNCIIGFNTQKDRAYTLSRSGYSSISRTVKKDGTFIGGEPLLINFMAVTYMGYAIYTYGIMEEMAP